MRANVSEGSKGRVRVEFDESRLLPREQLHELAHQLRDLYGVKRALVRNENGQRFIYARINTSIEGVVRKIELKVHRFLKALFAPPAPRRRNGKVFHKKPVVMLARQRARAHSPRLVPAR